MNKGLVKTRYTVALPPDIAAEVERHARSADISMSSAIAGLVEIGLERQDSQKRDFFKRLRANLDNDDPAQQDQLVDDFRNLILRH